MPPKSFEYSIWISKYSNICQIFDYSPTKLIFEFPTNFLEIFQYQFFFHYSFIVCEVSFRSHLKCCFIRFVFLLGTNCSGAGIILLISSKINTRTLQQKLRSRLLYTHQGRMEWILGETFKLAASSINNNQLRYQPQCYLVFLNHFFWQGNWFFYL